MRYVSVWKERKLQERGIENCFERSSRCLSSILLTYSIDPTILVFVEKAVQGSLYIIQ